MSYKIGQIGKSVESGFIGKKQKKEGFHPTTSEIVWVDRRELFTDFELPMRDEYNQFISGIIDRNETPQR